MKLGHVVAAAVLLAPIPFAGMTQPAAARNTHAVAIRGLLTVRDSPGHSTAGARRFFDINEQANLTHDDPAATLRVEGCAGGETRGVLSVGLRLDRSETVRTSAMLYLYEESNCNNNDLDGTVRAPIKAIALDRDRSLRMTVQNDEFLSDDFVKADFTITHRAGADVGRPIEPSNVVASRVPGNSHLISVTWDDNATNETGYELRNTTTNQIKHLAPNTKESNWTMPIVFKTCFQVRAVGDRGPSDWTPVGTEVECT